MFRFFENLIAPTGGARHPSAPPTGLLRFDGGSSPRPNGCSRRCSSPASSSPSSMQPDSRFYRPARSFVTTTPREAFWVEHGAFLAAMAIVVVVGRPIAIALQSLISNAGIMANVTNLVGWQSHRHVVRQSWPFFQNDFAGPHRGACDGDRRFAAPERNRHRHRRLGHPDLQRQRIDPARHRQPVADAAYPRMVRLLRFAAALLRSGAATGPSAIPRRGRSSSGGSSTATPTS